MTSCKTFDLRRQKSWKYIHGENSQKRYFEQNLNRTFLFCFFVSKQKVFSITYDTFFMKNLFLFLGLLRKTALKAFRKIFFQGKSFFDIFKEKGFHGNYFSQGK